MPKFSFEKIVDVNRDKFFTISTDYEKFTVILPDYFKELKIIETHDNITKIFERGVIATSFSKDLSLAGERIGYLAINPENQNKEELISALNFSTTKKSLT